jgi:hypothetical protein
MDEHERLVANEQAKDYAELLKIRENLNEKMSHWDTKLTESKENIRHSIHNDVEKQTKEIHGERMVFFLSIKSERFLFSFRTRKGFVCTIR